jgi:hypothetical protein
VRLLPLKTLQQRLQAKHSKAQHFRFTPGPFPTSSTLQLPCTPCDVRTYHYDTQDTVEPFDYRAAPAAAGTPTGPRYRGGYSRPGTWLQYAKQFADTVNG